MDTRYPIVGNRTEIRQQLDAAGDANEFTELTIVTPDDEHEKIYVRPTVWHYSDTARNNTLLALEESFGYPVHILFTEDEITLKRIDR